MFLQTNTIATCREAINRVVNKGLCAAKLLFQCQSNTQTSEQACQPLVFCHWRHFRMIKYVLFPNILAWVTTLFSTGKIVKAQWGLDLRNEKSQVSPHMWLPFSPLYHWVPRLVTSIFTLVSITGWKSEKQEGKRRKSSTDQNGGGGNEASRIVGRAGRCLLVLLLLVNRVLLRYLAAPLGLLRTDRHLVQQLKQCNGR